MRFIFLTLMVLMLMPLQARAQDAALTLQAKDVYAYATTPVQKNGAAFGILENTGQADIEIVEAKSDIAERVELHTHLMDGDVMMMRKVESYNVPAGGSLTLEPMGNHIMLFGLKNPLKAGEEFTVELVDADGNALSLPVQIKNPGDVAE